MHEIDVTTTYLELASPTDFKPATRDDPDLLVMESREVLPAWYRFLYGTVGQDYAWYGRLSWSDVELRGHLQRPSVRLLVLYVRGTPAGYIELDSESEEPGTEIVYFGLVPAFHGRGLGKHLLSVGVQRALDTGAQRVWLHTCSLDGPYALANYQARGFRPYKVTTERQTVPAPRPPGQVTLEAGG